MLFENLQRDELIKAIKMFSKSLLSVDGLWFLAVEDKYGLDDAIPMDIEVWKRFGPIDARRIKRTFGINEGGIASIIKAIKLSPTWFAMEYEFTELTKNRAVFRITECPPQKARVRNERGEFPCKPVNLAYLTEFAKTIDPKAKVRCIVAPPDPHPKEFWCEWEIVTE